MFCNIKIARKMYYEKHRHILSKLFDLKCSLHQQDLMGSLCFMKTFQFKIAANCVIVGCCTLRVLSVIFFTFHLCRSSAFRGTSRLIAEVTQFAKLFSWRCHACSCSKAQRFKIHFVMEKFYVKWKVNKSGMQPS